MKKFGWLLVLIIMSFSFMNVTVLAESEGVGKLIPVGQSGSVTTDNFKYENITYSGETISFNFINTTKTKKPISVDIGLFGKDEKNIGRFRYCSNKDYDTEFSSVEIKKGEARSFQYKLSSKYLGKKAKLSDIAYIAFLSDNIDEGNECFVGGYDNYIGSKINKIMSNEGSKSKNPLDEIDIDIDKIKPVLIITIGVIITVYLIIGIIINSLNYRMNNRKTILAYIPICSNYICVKLAFGKLVAIVYLILLAIDAFIGMALFSSLLYSVAFIIVIVKLITKKYNLFIFDFTKSYNKVAKLANDYNNDNYSEEEPADINHNSLENMFNSNGEMNDNISNENNMNSDTNNMNNSANNDTSTNTNNDMSSLINANQKIDLNYKDNGSGDDLFNMGNNVSNNTSNDDNSGFSIGNSNNNFDINNNSNSSNNPSNSINDMYNGNSSSMNVNTNNTNNTNLDNNTNNDSNDNISFDIGNTENKEKDDDKSDLTKFFS